MGEMWEEEEEENDKDKWNRVGDWVLLGEKMEIGRDGEQEA